MTETRLTDSFGKGGRLVGRTQDTLTDMYNDRLYKKVTRIFDDDTHPLRQEFDSLVIGRSGRLRTPRIRTQRYHDALVPKAVQIFNSHFTR